MGTPLPPGSAELPPEPGEPSNRWPWLALALGVLVIVVAAAFFFINQQRTVNVNVTAQPTANALAAASTASATLTLTPPPTATPQSTATRQPTATVAPSPTAMVTPTQPLASPTPLPAPTQPVAVETPAAPQPTQPPLQAAQPTEPAAATVPPSPTAPAATVVPSPTAFAGQVASPGGIGNTRADLDAAYGAPAGETPEHLVVYRKGNFEDHVGFVPDPSGRAALVVRSIQRAAGPTPAPFTLDQATSEAHRLLPRDAQPPTPQQEGNPQFVVERFTSQTLAQALPAEVFTANKGQPGQFLVVYVRDPAQSTRVTRFIIGPGSDPNALLSLGR